MITFKVHLDIVNYCTLRRRFVLLGDMLIILLQLTLYGYRAYRCETITEHLRLQFLNMLQTSIAKVPTQLLFI